MKDGHLIKAAMKLAQAADKIADQNLPEKLAEMVKLHAKIAVGSAFIPIPGADMAAAATNIWTMYVRINKELDLPFSENVIKSLAAGVATNVGSAAAGFIVVGSALKFIPGLGTVGGIALMAGTVYGVTIAAGIVYMNVIARLLEKQALENISEADLIAEAEREMQDKAALKDIIKSAKKDYKEK
jgi:uncharacterized protein (DUF697 family)